ncbi:MAG: T9SS type A sorting domain-containing protein [Salinivirgaceae bacterium]|nr:T9SS type A sorting domain-containing protein [Salinivirgaceae bacterium]
MKQIISLLFLFGITISGILAQEVVPVSGGDGSGNRGSVSYSVGQVAYNFNTGNNGTVTQGVQQAYEIYVTTGINETDISLSVSAYPNPTSNYLNLKIENFELSTFNFQLFDMQGKLIQTQKIMGNETQIDMSNYVSSTYFVRIINQNQSIKEFKIIKQ